jgi:hypothetical protein
MKKKRRIRKPFIVISEWKGKRQQETRWDFTINDIKKDIDKWIKIRNWFFTNSKSSHIGDSNYNPDNYKLINILVYSKKWQLLINNGSKTRDIYLSIDAATKKEALSIIKIQYPKCKILEIKEGIQII